MSSPTAKTPSLVATVDEAQEWWLQDAQWWLWTCDFLEHFLAIWLLDHRNSTANRLGSSCSTLPCLDHWLVCTFSSDPSRWNLNLWLFGPINDKLRGNEPKFLILMKIASRWYIICLGSVKFQKSLFEIELSIKFCLILRVGPTGTWS